VDDLERARSICLRSLAQGQRTRFQLEQLLGSREVPTQIIEELLDRFTEVGLVDDAAFARDWVEARHRTRGSSARALTQELRQKGIPEEMAVSAAGVIDEAQERAKARSLADRWLATRGQSQPSRGALERKLFGLLTRRGYSASLAAEVVREACWDRPPAQGDWDG
jgi:regulatory protein